jgi:hypothetical protein
MTNLKLPIWANDKPVFAVVETPRGSTCKLDLDPDLGVFTLAKPTMAGLSYPMTGASSPRPRQRTATLSIADHP